MKAEELFVGALVRVNRDGLCIKKDTIVEVRGVDADDRLAGKGLVGGAHCRPLDENQFAGGIWCEYLDPIPLTPEILEKNGFDYEKTHDVWILEYGEIVIEVGIYHPDFINVSYKQITPDGNNEGNISNICKVDGSDIMTHELQHALRLCGIKKEIEL